MSGPIEQASSDGLVNAANSASSSLTRRCALTFGGTRLGRESLGFVDILKCQERLHIKCAGGRAKIMRHKSSCRWLTIAPSCSRSSPGMLTFEVPPAMLFWTDRTLSDVNFFTATSRVILAMRV